MFSSRKSTSTSAKRVSQFQEKLAQEGELIMKEKLEAKLADLDRLCEHDLLKLDKIQCIRKYTLDNIEKYVEEQEKEAEKSEKAGNPLMQLLTGGLGAEPAGPLGEEEEYFSAEEEDAGDAKNCQPKLLLDTIKLSEKNKINLRLCLELDQPEAKAPKKQQKLVEIEAKNPEEEAIAPSAAPTKKTKKTNRRSNMSIQSESEDDEPKAKKSKKEDKEPEVIVSEIFQKSEPVSKKVEEKKKEKPIVKSNKHNIQVIELIKPHMDEIVDMCMTLRAWLESFITKNKNIGGADFQAELQQETVGVIKGVEDEALTMKELFAAYYIARAGIIEKYVKEPYIEDYKNFVVDEDEKMFITIRQCILSIRNAASSMYTDISNDYDKLFPSGIQDDVSFSMY